jgi:outer membrane lipoprotein-sorting protein
MLKPKGIWATACQLAFYLRVLTVVELSMDWGRVMGLADRILGPLVRGRGLKAGLIMVVLLAAPLVASAENETGKDRIFSLAKKMAVAFQKVEDYTCEVEEIYYKDGVENGRYGFKYYFKKGKKIRVEFSDPYPGTVILYQQGDRKATLIPIRFLSPLKVRVSVENAMIKTPTGQRIDQTDMDYFINFLFQNIAKVEQKEDGYHEDEERVTFLLSALDYIKLKDMEKYHVVVSKRHWLPVLIERYDRYGNPLEIAHIKDYIINSGLEDNLFQP